MSVLFITTLAILLTGQIEVKAAITARNSEPCHYFDSVRIKETNATQDPITEDLTYNNVIYKQTQFGWFDYVYVNGERVKSERHLRACLCAAGACFRVCQEDGSLMAPITVLIGNNATTLPADRLVYGRPCAQMHQGNDKVLDLLESGEIFDSEHYIMINHQFYCLNVVKNVVVSKLFCNPDPPNCHSLQTAEIEDNDYQRLPNDSIIYKNLLFNRSQWGYVSSTDHEGRTKNLRVCYCDKVECIRLCCPLDHIGDDCMHLEKGYKIIRDIKIGDTLHGAVNLLDAEYSHRLVHGDICSTRVGEEDDGEEVTHLRSDGTLVMTNTKDNSIFEYPHDKYCLRVNGSLFVSAEFCLSDAESGHPFSESLPYFMIVSIPFLVITFLVYGLIPELRNMNGKCLMFYVAGMTVYSITLPVINLSEHISHCALLGYITYFSLMLSFFWVNVMCFDMWLMFKGIRLASEQMMQFVYYNCYAIGGPLIMVAIVAIVDNRHMGDFNSGIGHGQCFFRMNSNAEMVFLFIPIGVLISMNICFFVAIHRNIKQTHNAVTMNKNTQRHSVNNHEDRERFVLYVRLMTIMGLTWTMEVVSWLFYKYNSNSKDYFVIFDVCNCLQGLWIFLLFVCKKKVLLLIRKRWNRYRGRQYQDSAYYNASKKTVVSNTEVSL